MLERERDLRMNQIASAHAMAMDLAWRQCLSRTGRRRRRMFMVDGRIRIFRSCTFDGEVSNSLGDGGTPPRRT